MSIILFNFSLNSGIDHKIQRNIIESMNVTPQLLKIVSENASISAQMNLYYCNEYENSSMIISSLIRFFFFISLNKSTHDKQMRCNRKKNFSHSYFDQVRIDELQLAH